MMQRMMQRPWLYLYTLYTIQCGVVYSKPIHLSPQSKPYIALLSTELPFIIVKNIDILHTIAMEIREQLLVISGFQLGEIYILFH